VDGIATIGPPSTAETQAPVSGTKLEPTTIAPSPVPREPSHCPEGQKFTNLGGVAVTERKGAVSAHRPELPASQITTPTMGLASNKARPTTRILAQGRTTDLRDLRR
jgi:hypothetical protein